MKQPLYIFEATRTPFQRMGTGFASLSAADLGKHITSSLIAHSKINLADLTEVIFGCVCQPSDSANIARVISLRAGIPHQIPAVTVHRNCASGMEAITTAYEKLNAGRGDLFLVGGVDSMSNVPFLYKKSAVKAFTTLNRAKTLGRKLSAALQFRPKDFAPIIGLTQGLTDPVVGMNMGETAELLAREYDISRTEQDEYAALSHQRALAAQDQRAKEISSIPVSGTPITEDNGIRKDSNTQNLSKLRPVFDRKTGTVTAGNSSQITDGAVALLVGSKEKGQELGLKPVGKLIDFCYTGCDPRRMGLGPVYAIHQLKKQGYDIDSADIIEINEAFAAQVIACHKALSSRKSSNDAGLGSILTNRSITDFNLQGGAIALGHPVGATGARLVLTALHQLSESKKKSALVSLCVGGGQGAALWVETIS